MRTQVLNPPEAAEVVVEATPFSGMLDVECGVDVYLGLGTLTIRQLLQLGPQSVVRLEQSAGDNLWVSLNGVLLARGEVVIVDDSTALRVVEIAAGSEGEGAVE